jgi:WD40 repeat protein
LELVVTSAASVAAVAPSEDERSSNLFQLARELRPEDAQGGRRLGDTHGSSTIDLTRDDGSNSNNTSVTKVRSILHVLPLLGPSASNADSKKNNSIVPYAGPQQEQPVPKPLPLSVASDFESIAKKTSDSMRVFLSTRESFRAAQDEVAVLQRAITNQESVKRTAMETLKTVGGDLVRAEIMFQESQNADRVLAQLGNKLTQVTGTRDSLRGKLVQTEQEARNTFEHCKKLAVQFRDPYQHQQTSFPSSIRMTGTMLDTSSTTARRNKNYVTSFLAARQCGVSRCSFKIGRPIGMADAKQTRKAVTAIRLSHALTFSTHLSCPIYCLSFDKSGRYFCTGADDCLVKVFFLGAGQSKRVRRSFTYGANDRGAIHVCTLRGHAGVICDLSVSSDNAFLATASDDGDVRVWGLKDGCPVSILRGHGGGANMVSWSKLTPYRLVTCGMNGLAQIWDIREAALKRYGTHIGQRPEYTLALTKSEKQTLNTESEAHSAQANDEVIEQVVLLPPLPAREGDVVPAAAAVVAPAIDPDVVLLPPLPVREGAAVPAAAAPPVDPADNLALPPSAAPINAANPVAAAPVAVAAAAAPNGGANNNNNIIAGAFVANDTLDEGVRIVAKLQHGEVVQEDNGPGTRARRKKVNVICIARCPLGGHFATGSDDGLCRVWEDADDGRVAMVDHRGKGATDRVGPTRSATGNVGTCFRRPIQYQLL